MANLILFISPAKLKVETALGGSVDDDILSPYIRLAQELHILPALGQSLYDDLKTTKATESQLRIAMLQALNNGMHSGEFEFNGEEVREECQLRKCYDAPNFTANFKNKKEFFEDFTKYKKKSPIIYLSSEGKLELAGVIRQLQ